MERFVIWGQRAWCEACANSTGFCASVGPAAGLSDHDESGRGSGMSKVAAGLIGATVTLAVVLVLEPALVMVGRFEDLERERIRSKECSVDSGEA